jgi:hypothetical protein
MAAAQSSDALSIIGFFLTLAGLLGSFFYVHLGEWYREVLALEVKWRLNRAGDEDDQKAARRECRYEAEQMANWTTLVTSLVVTGFIVLVSVLSLVMWLDQPSKSDAWWYIAVAGLAFLAIYLAMAGFFVVQGYRKARQVHQEVRERMPLPKA